MSKPWDINPQLTKDHLIEMAGFISSVRAEVVDLHDPKHLGDTARSLGFRAYECCRNRITREAAGNAKPWLSIITPENRFTFAINGVPIRFYRGSPSSPEERRLKASLEARSQMSLLPVEPSYANLLWYFVIETDENRYTDNVVFCAFREDTGEQVCYWEVPYKEQVPSVPTVVEAKAPPVGKRSVVLSVKGAKEEPRKSQENE